MKLTVIGMNGPFPAPGGATSGYLLESRDTKIQLDLGTGTLSGLTALCPPEKLDALVLSHWHHDHCSDVLPMLYRLQSCGSKPLDVYGPMDADSLERKALEADPCINLHTVCPGDTIRIGELSLTVGEARHPVPAILERWSDGEKTFVYTGDTNVVEGLTSFCTGADALLADGLFPAAMWTSEKPHLSAELCAKLAVDARVPVLMITHMNPNLDSGTVLAEARAIRPDTLLASPGAVLTV